MKSPLSIICILLLLSISCEKKPQNYTEEDFIGEYLFKYTFIGQSVEYQYINNNGVYEIGEPIISDTSFIGERLININYSTDEYCLENRDIQIYDLFNLSGICVHQSANKISVNTIPYYGEGTLLKDELKLEIKFDQGEPDAFSKYVGIAVKID